MSINFQCPTCGGKLSARADYAGKEGKCKCGTVLIVPGSDKMKFACGCCGKGISISIRHAGKQGRCPLCKGGITVPVPGILITPPQSQAQAQTAQAVPPKPAQTDTVAVSCMMCNSSFKAKQTLEDRIIECPKCGSYLEVPGKYPNTTPSAPKAEAVQKSSVLATKKCPSCDRKLPSDAPVCTQCGIYMKSGRPILTAWDVDPGELEEKAEGVVRTLSWLIPSGVYPIYSEAIGNHKPYATWGISAITVLISIWFLAIEMSGSPKMMSAKNLMLWNSNVQLDAEQIQAFYEFTSYGDAAAFNAKKEELSKTTPEDELDVAALKAMDGEQSCFGKFKFHQLVTHAFLHGGIMHLAGNMLFLIVLGSRVNAAIGNIWTLVLYPILAIAAAVTHLLSMGVEPPTPMLGASGAVMGLAGAYLLLFPIHKIYMVAWLRWGLIGGFHLSFKCFAVRGVWVVLFYIMFDVIAVSLMVSDGTAHWAHIGGLVWGFLIAFALLASRMVYSGSDMLSLILGKYAWSLIGSPAKRLK